MTRENVVGILKEGLYENFASEMTQMMVERDALDYIYDLAANKVELNYPKVIRDQICFRAAYVLETVYFRYNHLFEKYIGSFFVDFPDTVNESAKRHFTKMMVDLLKKQKPDREICEAVAEASVRWITESKSRIAVKIGAVEVLLELAGDVEWIRDILPELLEPLRQNATPGLAVRLKRWKTRLS